MKIIWKIFNRDLRTVRKNVTAAIIIIGMAVIPALYAWFNIAAFWDPYNNTDGIKVAVVNLDEGYTIDEGADLTINVGDQIISTLQDNNQIGWTFTNYDIAMESVKRGDVYAAIIIPKDFSQKTASIISDDIQHPAIEYYVNEKKNAIAPKITDQGITIIQQQVNSTFIKVAAKAIAGSLNVSMEELDNLGISPLQDLINVLTDTNTDMQLLSSSITSTQNMIDATNSLITAIQDTLPQLDVTFSQGNTTIEDSQTMLTNMDDLSGLITDMLDESLNSNNQLINSLSDLFNNISDDSGQATDALAGQLQNLSELTLTIADTNQQAYLVLAHLMDNFPADSALADAWKEIKQGMQSMIDNQQTLGNKLADAATEVQNNGKLSSDLHHEIEGLLTQTQANSQTLRSEYKTELKPALESSFGSTNLMLDDLSSLLASLEKDTDSVKSTLSAISETLDSISSSLSSTQETIDTISGKLQNIVSELNHASEGDEINTLMDILQNDPDVISDFVSSPVEIETNTIYPIKNYGSAMAPFFTMLAIWVGGIIMIAILKVRVKEDETLINIRPYQAYFGKYLFFALIGLVQATIVCLGDIYFMQIQCLHPFLFIFAGWFASLVFTLIIYTLTVSFGNVGKAISVLILVVSIAGAGGTFPIEMTPPFFQKIYPFVPFTYAINAMRAAVAGVYAHDYLLDLLKVLLHVPGMLILGLVLRNPLIRLNQFFDDRMKDSDIM